MKKMFKFCGLIILAGLGITIIGVSAAESGSCSPERASWAIACGVALLGIGAFLSKINEEHKLKRNNRRNG